jgi:glycosyltransferase involved in cell wall biosynthesis
LRNSFNIDDFCKTKKDFFENDYFLYYGRLSEKKGAESLILAAKKMKDENQLGKNKLIIVGKGAEEKGLKNLVKELKMENEIEFLGFKKGEELKDLVSGSKFVVLPSIWYDNSPTVIVESQLFEKPIVVSGLGGSKETIIDQKSGLVFRAGDISDLAEKIDYMLKISPEERKKMGQIGAQNIREMFNEEKLYEEFMEIYNNLSVKSLPK